MKAISVLPILLRQSYFKNEGWKNKAIAQALRIHEDTIRYYITDGSLDEKLKPENGGAYSKLNDTEMRTPESHLEVRTYTRVIDICAYVEKTYGVRYTVSGFTKWLHNIASVISSLRRCLLKLILLNKKNLLRNRLNKLQTRLQMNPFFLWIQLIQRWPLK